LGIGGQVTHKATFSFPFQLKTHRATLEILEAYDMEPEHYYLLLVNENDPEEVVSIEQFSKSFIRYCLRTNQLCIKQAMREQGLKVQSG